MKPLLATVAMLLLAACASAPEPTHPDANSLSDGRFTSGPRGDEPQVGDGPRVGHAMLESAPDPDEPITIDFVSKGVRPGYNPVAGLEAMPFGGGMFGPWDIGGPGGESGLEHEILDFRGRDIHTAMHYIALRSNLQIIMEGDISLAGPIYVRVPADATPRDRAILVLKSICKANKLDYILDGNVVIIKRRPAESSLAHVVLSELEGRFNVGFEDHEVVAAIMEVATVTKTQVFVPAQRANEAAQLEPVKVSLHMRAAIPERILGRLAELGGMEIEQVTLEDSVDGAGVGYKFKYRE